MQISYAGKVEVDGLLFSGVGAKTPSDKHVT